MKSINGSVQNVKKDNNLVITSRRFATAQAGKINSTALEYIKNKPSSGTPVKTAKQIVKGTSLVKQLKKLHKQCDFTTADLVRFYPEPIVPPGETQKELVSVIENSLNLITDTLNEHASFLKKDINLSPDKNILKIALENFKSESLLTRLILSVSQLPKKSQTVIYIKEIFENVSTHAKDAVKSGDPEKAEKAGRSLGILSKACTDARNILALENQSRDKTVKYSIALIGDFAGKLFKIPTGTIRKIAEDLFASKPPKENHRKKLMTNYYDPGHEECSRKLLSGFNYGKALLEKSI
ncbi:MAG: hypothetical protein ABIH00_02490 [Armatimonadota bacterium]